MVRSGFGIACALVGLCCAEDALAKIPSAANSTIPNAIFLVGFNPNHVPPEDAAGRFRVVVRSIDDLPLPGVTVTVNLGNAGARLSRVQTFPGVSLDCNAETISGVTDSQGQVDFVILGGGPDVATAHPFAELRAEIRARGVHLGMSRVAAYDLVGTLNGLDQADFAACIGAVLRRIDAPPMIAGLADYDFNGRLQSKDLAIWLSEYLSRRSESNSGAVCP